MNPILRAHNLSFAYDDQPVLRDINLTLSPGEIVALIGPNGSGKSTLIRLLLGHLHAKGDILWDDRNIRLFKPRDLARRVAYLPQSPTWDVEHRVADVLRLGRTPYWSAFGIETTKDAQVIDDVARQLQLDQLIHRRMDELSGGQRQRVFLGRCLVQQPAALLLDEPNTYLDIKHQVELGLLLQNLARQTRVAVLMASHDLNLAAMLADRLILLSNGMIAATGTPHQVLLPDLLTQVYGIPMQRINSTLPTPLIMPIISYKA